MGRIYAIAINTFREAVRDRVLYGMLGFAFAILLFTLALAQLSLHEEQRIILDVGLATISLFSVLMAVFLGSSLLYKEIERRTLYVILPKPIARAEFLLGKFFGIVLTAAVFIIIKGAVLFWVVAVQRDAPMWAMLTSAVVLIGSLIGFAWKSRDRTAVVIPWATAALLVCAGLAVWSGAAVGPVLIALALSIGEVLVIAAVAMLFSSFSTPFLTGVFTLGVWIVGRSADDMQTMRSNALPGGVKALLHGLARVVPNLNLFVPGRHTLEGLSREYGGPTNYLMNTMGYAALYAGVLLLFAAWIFRRRDFV